MEFTPIKPTVLKWGLYTGLAAAVYTIVLYASDSMNNTMLTTLLYVISIGGVVLTLREYKSLNEGFMPFGTGFKAGFLSSFLAGVVSLVITQIYTSFINTEAIPKLLEAQRMKLEENPQMTEEIIDMSMSWAEKLTDPMIAIPFSLFMGAIGAALIAVIVAAIMKNDPNG